MACGRINGRLLAVLVVVLGVPLAAARTASAAEGISFNRQIRPILSDKCFACHGPDDNRREGGFRLDRKDSALGAAESGEMVIVPGKPEESALIARIVSDDPDLQMPPPDSNKSLSPEQIELLRNWIKQGAEWRELWSLTPPERPEVPAVRRQDWPRNAIDHFILARLEAEGLNPASEAEKTNLIRRVTLDLTGLPPTLEEVDAFLADDRPDAYERLVDRLLKKDAFGEHMARFWLDAARYGDTHGLHLDNYREMWPYRDWVVKAFNENKPYDQFAVEQLAGDLLPDPTLDQLVATGFNRAHVTTSEGGSIAEEVYVRNVVDRVVTFGTVFMGLTLECSRCHDHKFDPLTMNDFYSLFAYFNSLDGNPLDGNRKDHAPVIRVPTAEQQARLAELDGLIAAAERKLRDPWPEVDAQQEVWEQQLLAAARAESTPDGESPGNGESPEAAGTVPGPLTLGDWHSVGPFADNRRYLYSRKHGPEGKPVKLDETFTLSDDTTVGWQRHPEWKDGTPHSGLPGDMAANFLYRTIQSSSERKITVSLGSDDAIKVYLNDKQVLAKDVARAVAPDQEQLELALRKGENHLLLKIMNYGGAAGFYFAVTSGETAIPPEIMQLVGKPGAERSQEEQQKLRDFYRNKVASLEMLEQARKELEQVRNQRAEVDRGVPTTLVWKETKDPRPAYHLKRGEYDQRGDQVGRRGPSALPPISDQLPQNRLGLARWLTSPQHPLTARVAVNRFWQQVFGTGLVKTAEDFGSQGEPPSHPELLDWLAVQFMEDGWDTKGLMKQLVMSATYRQSSRVDPEVYRRDPGNRLLARGPRFRLDAEMLRDQALAVSDLLVQKLGGPSVKPPQPDGLWFAVGYSGSNTVRFVGDKGRDKVHRRTLYTFIKRTAPPPQLSMLDAPSREACVMRRERTNTPLQALMLFNDPQFVEAARGLAQRVVALDSSDAAFRAARMFRLATCRQPTEDELRELVAAYEEELAHFQQDQEAARKLLQVGELPAADEPAASELAAWTMVANMILNLDEVLTKN